MDISSYVVPEISGKVKVASELVLVKSVEGKYGLFQPAWKQRVVVLSSSTADHPLEFLVYKIKGSSLQLGEQIQLFPNTVVSCADESGKFRFSLSSSPEYGFQCSSKAIRTKFILKVLDAISRIVRTVSNPSSPRSAAALPTTLSRAASTSNVSSPKEQRPRGSFSQSSKTARDAGAPALSTVLEPVGAAPASLPMSLTSPLTEAHDTPLPNMTPHPMGQSSLSELDNHTAVSNFTPTSGARIITVDDDIASAPPTPSSVQSSRSRLGNSNPFPLTSMVQCEEPTRRQKMKDTERGGISSSADMLVTSTGMPHCVHPSSTPHSPPRTPVQSNDMNMDGAASANGALLPLTQDLSLDDFHEMVHRTDEQPLPRHIFSTSTPTEQKLDSSPASQMHSPASIKQSQFAVGSSEHEDGDGRSFPVLPSAGDVSSSSTGAVCTSTVSASKPSTPSARPASTSQPVSPSADRSYSVEPPTSPSSIQPETEDLSLMQREIKALLLVNKQISDLYESKEKSMNEMSQEHSLALMSSQIEIHSSQQLLVVSKQQETELQEKLAEQLKRCEGLNEKVYVLEEERDNQDKTNESLRQENSNLLERVNGLQEQSDAAEVAVCGAYKAQLEELGTVLESLRGSNHKCEETLGSCQLNLEETLRKVAEKNEEIDVLQSTALSYTKTIDELTNQVHAEQEAKRSLEARIRKEVEDEMLVENGRVKELTEEKKQLCQRNLQWEKDMSDSEENIKRLHSQLQEQDTYAAELKLELDALKQISIQYTRMCDESRRKELLIVDAEAKNQFLQTQLDTSTRTLQNLQLSHDKTLLAFRRAEDDRIVLEESVRKQFKQRDTEIENQSAECKALQQRLDVCKEVNERLSESLEVATKDQQSEMQKHAQVTFELQNTLDESRHNYKEVEHQLSQLELNSNNEIISLKRSVSELEVIQRENRETIQQQGRLLQSTQESLHESTHTQELANRSKESFQQKFKDAEDGRKRDQIRHDEMMETLQEEVRSLRVELSEQSEACEEKEFKWGEKKNSYVAHVHAMSVTANAQERSVKQLQDQLSEVTSTAAENKDMLEAQLTHVTLENKDLLEKLGNLEHSMSIKVHDHRAEMTEKLKNEYEWKAAYRQQSTLLCETQKLLEVAEAACNDEKLKCSKLESDVAMCEKSIGKFTVQLEELTEDKKNRIIAADHSASLLQENATALTHMEQQYDRTKRELDGLKEECVVMESTHAEHRLLSDENHRVALAQKQVYYEGLLSEQSATHNRALKTTKAKCDKLMTGLQQKTASDLSETINTHDDVVASLKKLLVENEQTAQEHYGALQMRLEAELTVLHEAHAAKEQQYNAEIEKTVLASNNKYNALSHAHHDLLEKQEQLALELDKNAKINRESQVLLQKMKKKGVSIEKKYQSQSAMVKTLEDRCQLLESDGHVANEALKMVQKDMNVLTAEKIAADSELEHSQCKIREMETELGSVITEKYMNDRIETIGADFIRQLTQNKVEKAEIMEERKDLLGKVAEISVIMETNNDFWKNIWAKIDSSSSDVVSEQDVFSNMWDTSRMKARDRKIMKGRESAEEISAEVSKAAEECCVYGNHIYDWCKAVSVTVEKMWHVSQQHPEHHCGEVFGTISQLRELSTMYEISQEQYIHSTENIRQLKEEICGYKDKLEYKEQRLHSAETDAAKEVAAHHAQLTNVLQQQELSKEQHDDKLSSITSHFKGMVEERDGQLLLAEDSLKTAQLQLTTIEEKMMVITQENEHSIVELTRQYENQIRQLEGSCKEYALRIQTKENAFEKLQKRVDDANISGLVNARKYEKFDVELGSLRQKIEDYKSALKTKNSLLSECQMRLEKSELLAAREASGRLELQKQLRRAGLDKSMTHKASADSVDLTSQSPLVRSADSAVVSTNRIGDNDSTALAMSDLNGIADVSATPSNHQAPPFLSTTATGSGGDDSNGHGHHTGGTTAPAKERVPRSRNIDELRTGNNFGHSSGGSTVSAHTNSQSYPPDHPEYGRHILHHHLLLKYCSSPLCPFPSPPPVRLSPPQAVPSQTKGLINTVLIPPWFNHVIFGISSPQLFTKISNPTTTATPIRCTFLW